MDMISNCMTYTDVIYLFKEVGNCIQKMAYSTNNGIYYDNSEFSMLMAQIMEYIAWEKSTLELICNGLDKSIMDHILFMRYIDFANSIKLRCVNAIFDHMIHNSRDLVQLIKLKKDDNVLKMLYKNIL